ncbi:MAG: hypothetical protein ACRDO2_00935 [Nocardioidaceae bacterium]
MPCVGATSAYSTHTALRSADGRFWGECLLSGGEGGEFDSAITLYRTDPDRHGGLSFGYGCPQVPDQTETPACEAITFHMVDRRPAEVAKVKAVLVNGEAVWATTNQGYFAIDTAFPVPEDVVMTADGLPSAFTPLRSLAFYDGQGELLAEQSFLEPLDGEDPGTLNAYPSMAGKPL